MKIGVRWSKEAQSSMCLHKYSVPLRSVLLKCIRGVDLFDLQYSEIYSIHIYER